MTNQETRLRVREKKIRDHILNCYTSTTGELPITTIKNLYRDIKNHNCGDPLNVHHHLYHQIYTFVSEGNYCIWWQDMAYALQQWGFKITQEDARTNKVEYLYIHLTSAVTYKMFKELELC